MDDPGRELYSMAMQNFNDYQTSMDEEVLHSAIRFGKSAVDATPEDHPDLPGRNADLGTMLAHRYELKEDANDLENAINLTKSSEATAICKYDRTHQLRDLNHALDATQKTVDLAQNADLDKDPNLVKYLNNLAMQLSSRSERERSDQGKADAEKAVELGQDVLKMVEDDDGDLPKYLNNLGNYLNSLYEQDDKLETLDKAIRMGHLAKTKVLKEHPMLSMILHNLGIRLERRYIHEGRRKDLDEAIGIAYQVIELVDEEDPNFAIYLNTLAVKLQSLYDHDGRVEDLKEAIEHTRNALNLAPDECHDRADWLNNLGTLLESLFRRTGEAEYATEAVNAAKHAVKLTTTTDTDYAAYLINLANNLESRFTGNGHLQDLDDAISAAELSVKSASESDPRLGAYITGLGTKFGHRYEITGDMTDLEEAIRCARKAERMTEKSRHIYPNYLNNLGNVLQVLYQRTHAMKHLNEAIALFQKAVHLTDMSHQDYAAWQISLANNLGIRYDHQGSITDLEEAIKLAEEIARFSAGNHIDRDPGKDNLAGLLCKRYRSNKNASDLDTAIRLTQEVLASTNEGGPNWSSYMRNLGIRLGYRYDFNSDTKDRDAALDCFVRSSQALQATPIDRVQASREAIRILMGKGDWLQAQNLAVEALKLLPLVCSRYVGLQDQQYALTQTSGFAADTCSLSLKIGDVESAIQQLEFGRAIIVGYMNDSRSDLSQLRLEFPKLAAEYEALRHRASRKIDSQDASVRDKLIKERRDAVQEIEACIKKIRHERRYQNFLLGPTMDELKEAGSAGPIVVVNVTDISAYALIVSVDGVSTIQLPGLLNKTTPLQLQHELRRYKDSCREAYTRNMEGEDEPEDELNLLPWLWTNCVQLILEKLRTCGQPEAILPHIWWIGTGIASSLPFHAAGEAFENSTENALRYMIPSYTTSIRTLLHSRAQLIRIAQREEKIRSILIITMPDTPGQRPLPGVQAEKAAIERICKQAYSVEKLEQRPMDEVLSRLPSAEIAHFAFHAFSDPIDLSSSHILLQKPGDAGPVVDRLSLAQIADVITADQAQIAFLSACSTAEVRASKLVDEGLHLASAFQVAGFNHVIGSLSSANDDACVRVTEVFYKNLVRKDGATYSEGAVASALREAVLNVREQYPREPKRWAPFIHLGV